jgi:hypothetical protein
MALIPPRGTIQDLGQKSLFLIVVAIGEDDRGDHAHAEGNDWRAITFHLFVPEQVMLRGVQSPRPVQPINGREPALLVQLLLPEIEITLAQMEAAPNFVGQTGGQVFLNELTRLGVKGQTAIANF